jgi:hypothetical protein
MSCFLHEVFMMMCYSWLHCVCSVFCNAGVLYECMVLAAVDYDQCTRGCIYIYLHGVMVYILFIFLSLRL